MAKRSVKKNEKPEKSKDQLEIERLEKHVANGKELLVRVTRRLAKSEDEINTLKGMLKASEAYIGIMGAWGKNVITKEMLEDFIKTKKVRWEESDDKNAVIIFVEERTDMNADVEETGVGVSPERDDNTGASEGSPIESEGHGGEEQVQEH